MNPDQTFHIYKHVYGTENICREEENYRYFLQQHKKYLEPTVETLAYLPDAESF
ncbi:MAG: hypothetical protein WD426_04645 [Anditalea sp.]